MRKHKCCSWWSQDFIEAQPLQNTISLQLSNVCRWIKKYKHDFKSWACFNICKVVVNKTSRRKRNVEQQVQNYYPEYLDFSHAWFESKGSSLYGNPFNAEHSQSLEVELTNSKDIEFAWELLDYDHTNVETCLALKVDVTPFHKQTSEICSEKCLGNPRHWEQTQQCCPAKTCHKDMTRQRLHQLNLVIINVLGIVDLLSLPDTLALRVRHVVDNPLQSTQTNEAAQPAQAASESVVVWLDNGSIG